eukprot:3224703-Rhodomonas_salina.2
MLEEGRPPALVAATENPSQGIVEASCNEFCIVEHLSTGQLCKRFKAIWTIPGAQVQEQTVLFCVLRPGVDLAVDMGTAQLLGRHTHLCRLLANAAHQDGQVERCLIFELPALGALDTVLAICSRDATAISNAVVLTICQQVCSAMTELVARGVVHGNLSTGSVLVFGFDPGVPSAVLVKLCDYERVLRNVPQVSPSHQLDPPGLSKAWSAGLPPSSSPQTHPRSPRDTPTSGPSASSCGSSKPRAPPFRTLRSAPTTASAPSWAAAAAWLALTSVGSRCSRSWLPAGAHHPQRARAFLSSTSTSASARPRSALQLGALAEAAQHVCRSSREGGCARGWRRRAGSMAAS